MLTDLVTAGAAADDFAEWKAGTPFLTQLHDDLGALLDAGLTQGGDNPNLSGQIDQQIVGRFAPALDASSRPYGVLVIWLDPIQVDFYGPDKKNDIQYDLQTNSYANSFATAFANVTGNVELVALPFVAVGVENYLLDVVPTPEARGGVVYFGPAGVQFETLTSALREGVSQFNLAFGAAAAPEAATALTDPAGGAARGGGGGSPDGWVTQLLADFRGGRAEPLTSVTISPLGLVEPAAEGSASTSGLLRSGDLAGITRWTPARPNRPQVC